MGNEKTLVTKWHIKGLDGSIYDNIPGLREAMIHEYVRFYNMYCEKTNGGVTEMLNKEFNQLYPTYSEETKDLEWYEMTLYNQFMADGYMQHIVNDINKSEESPMMGFYVDPEEIVFTGLLKVNGKIIEPHISINFSLVEK